MAGNASYVAMVLLCAPVFKTDQELFQNFKWIDSVARGNSSLLFSVLDWVNRDQSRAHLRVKVSLVNFGGIGSISYPLNIR